MNGQPFSFDDVGESNQHFCFFKFPTVATGKLLVIRHVGAVVRPTDGSTIVEVAELVTSNPESPSTGVSNYFGMNRIGVAGTAIGADTWSMNRPVLAYVVATQSASLTINLRHPGNVLFSEATISGVIVDIA
jgi:hypothetical protein